MRRSKKESRQVYMSVEGKNCETFYFEHLAKLINESDRSTYNLKIKPVMDSPFSYAKRIAYKPVEKSNRADLPYFHIQDVEDYEDERYRSKFFHILDEMGKAQETFHIKYELGYSNYTFEVWMLLHVAGNANYAVTDRHSYLKLINRHFKRNYLTLDEFKKEGEFKKILEEFISLDSVFQAIAQAKKMEAFNAESGHKLKTYRGFKFYQDNPATSVHEVVEMIFDMCKVK